MLIKNKKSEEMRKSLIDKYEINVQLYKCKSINDSSLSDGSKNMLLDNNINTLLDLICLNPDCINDFFGYKQAYGTEIEDYLLELENNIVNSFDDFPPLEEYNMFLDAVNELMTLDPLRCVLCGKMPSTYKLNIADNTYINFCKDCGYKIKDSIYSFLSDKCFW